MGIKHLAVLPIKHSFYCILYQSKILQVEKQSCSSMFCKWILPTPRSHMKSVIAAVCIIVASATIDGTAGEKGGSPTRYMIVRSFGHVASCSATAMHKIVIQWYRLERTLSCVTIHIAGTTSEKSPSHYSLYKKVCSWLYTVWLVVFASQEPFAQKLKPRNFCCPTSKANKLCFTTWNYPSSSTRQWMCPWRLLLKLSRK